MEYGIELSQQSIIAVSIVCVLYVITITAFGGYFARFNQNINDFFYSGQRFAWWLPAASMVATGIGSYSYLKYSEQGFNTGMSSSLNYMNDWFIVPFFIFGWLPIVYYAKVKSIPEYFERRFNKLARYVALTIILAYMFFYIGYNLFTIGIAMEGMFQVPIKYSVPIVGVFLGAYVTFGGQTAVIFTDLFQGIMLYLAGGLAIFAGIYALGGFGEFWGWLPVSHRLPFVHLTEGKFNTAGLFWGEALAGSIAFNFMNQGFLMRYLTIKSVDEGRKAAMFNVLFTLPVSAIIVGAVGWIGQALVMKQQATGGALAGYNFVEIQNTFHTFIIVCWTTVKQNPWIFGFIIAALMAALMSTIDTLINACAAILINDLYKPLVKNNASDEHYLIAARWASIISAAVGMILVLFFVRQAASDNFSLMDLHYKGIMVIIPAVVTTIFLGAFWKRFNAPAACVSMVVGSLLTLYTAWGGEFLIEPVAAFVGGPTTGKLIYMRALFGMTVTATIGIIVTYLTQAEPFEKIKGLTIDTLNHTIESYKGGKPNYKRGKKARNLNIVFDNKLKDDEIQVSSAILKTMEAESGDLIYMEDSRWFLGGLRSNHVKVHLNASLDDNSVAMSEKTLNHAYLLDYQKVTLDKIF